MMRLFGCRTAFEIRNEGSDRLDVWVEPWCHPYTVPRRSTLKLSYRASGGAPLYTEHRPDLLVVWTNSAHAPTAELDGRRVEPEFGGPPVQP
jgi:hypothetical protein